MKRKPVSDDEFYTWLDGVIAKQHARTAARKHAPRKYGGYANYHKTVFEMFGIVESRKGKGRYAGGRK